MRKDRIRLGLSMRSLGYHVSAWRHPDYPPLGGLDFGAFVEAARAAESAKFDMVFLADTLSMKAVDDPPGAACRSSWNAELEPITLLSALATRTGRVGLVATASTSYNEPYNVARKFASLDHISGGRAGWNMVTSWSDKDSLNFNRETGLPYGERYERGREFVEVVQGLWDSWEDDAFIRDKEAGFFYDEKKLHALNHHGRYFSVKGPLTCPRTPQGRPVLVQAGASEEGREIAAAFGDVVYASADSMEAAQAYYADVKRRLPDHGRGDDDLKFFFGTTIFVAETKAQAQAQYDQLQELIDPMVGVAAVSRKIPGLSHLPLDEPLTDIDVTIFKSGGLRLREIVRREKPTLRQFYKMIGTGTTQNVLIGTAAEVADRMEHWFNSYATDGFNITPSNLLPNIRDIARLLVPELQRRGLFRTEYEGRTLRENLGLAWPARRAARAGAAAYEQA